MWSNLSKAFAAEHWAAWAGVIVAIAGFYFAIRTLKGLARQNSIAESALKESRQAFLLTNRPCVRVRRVVLVKDPDTGFTHMAAYLEFTNIGNTDARVVDVRGGIQNSRFSERSPATANGMPCLKAHRRSCGQANHNGLISGLANSRSKIFQVTVTAAAIASRSGESLPGRCRHHSHDVLLPEAKPQDQALRTLRRCRLRIRGLMTSRELRNAQHYALEKLGDAVQVLVTYDSRVTGRVAIAAKQLLLVDRRVLPPSIRTRFDKLMRELTERPGYRAPFNFRGVRGTTGSKWALQIYSIELELQSFLNRGG